MRWNFYLFGKFYKLIISGKVYVKIFCGGFMLKKRSEFPQNNRTARKIYLICSTGIIEKK